ncbi:MAG: hypothetical protein IJH86_00385, partial [Clostridia bacterium]|nr:hypothetical protein [Clostridia bacterium]
MKKTMKRALALLIALLLALPNFAMAELAEALVSSAPVETEYGEAEQSLGNDADDAAASADSDADVPDEVTEDMPDDDAANTPADGASDVPADGSADAPADGASDVPADGASDVPADDAADVSVPQDADAPAEGSDEGQPGEGEPAAEGSDADQPADDTNPLDATSETPTSGEETGDGVVSADAPDAVEAEPGEGEELTLGDDEPETPEDAPEAAQTVRVLFDVFPGDAVVTVRAAQDDVVYAAMEDGAYLLPPGEYIYTAAAEGYISKEALFNATEDAAIHAVLEPVAQPFNRSALINGVVVTVQADAGVFPNDAVLSVTEAEAPAQDAAEAAVDRVRDEGKNVAARYTFDIKILDAEGNEIQPADSQVVSVSFSFEQVADENLTTSVYHIDGDDAEKLDVTTEDEITATVETESFSLYTVELTYEALSYSFPETGDVALDDILAQVGLSGGIEAVSVSDDTVLSATDESGAWIVTALEPFSGNREIAVTINGTEYTIVVDYIGAAYETPVDAVFEMGVEYTVEPETWSCTPDAVGEDNDALLDEYVQRMIDTAAGHVDEHISLEASVSLQGMDFAVYNQLADAVRAIAAGDRTSSEITITKENLESYGINCGPWTAADLGVSAIVVDGAITQEAAAAAGAHVSFSLKNVLNALLADFPADLYWYDKAKEGSFRATGFGLSATYEDDWKLCLTDNIVIGMMVSEDYAATVDGALSLYNVDADRVQTAKQAIQNARSIASDLSSSGTVFEILSAFKDTICGMTSYNTDALAEGTPYGDPWQLINVFDNDPGTEVVCEGYSKAFKFLFDLAEFGNNYDCILVTGQMTGATGEGPHMWNVVRMDNEANYLVDVTNCDEDTVGAPDKLFMAYGPTLGNDGSMTFAAGDNNITYAYDEDTQNTFDNWQLTIATAPYTPSSGGGQLHEGQYNISAGSSSDAFGGGINFSAYFGDDVAISADEGETISLRFNEASGFTLTGITLSYGGNDYPVDINDRQFIMPASEVTVTGYFTSNGQQGGSQPHTGQYPIYCSSSSDAYGGDIHFSAYYGSDVASSANEGETITLGFNEASGFMLTGITLSYGGNDYQVDINDRQFVMPAAEVTVTGYFSSNGSQGGGNSGNQPVSGGAYTISVNGGPSGGASAFVDGVWVYSADAGDTVCLRYDGGTTGATVTYDGGSIDLPDGGSNTPVAFTMPANNVPVTLKFNGDQGGQT